jgi:hypothetical protein
MREVWGTEHFSRKYSMTKPINAFETPAKWMLQKSRFYYLSQKYFAEFRFLAISKFSCVLQISG